MKTKSMKELAPSKLPKALLKGTGISLLITMIGATVMSWLIIRESLRETAVGFCAMGILMGASFFGSIFAMKMAETKRMQTALLEASCYSLILIMLNLLLYKGGYEGVGVTLMIIYGTAVASAMTHIGDTKYSRHRRCKKKHR